MTEYAEQELIGKLQALARFADACEKYGDAQVLDQAINQIRNHAELCL